mgnify:CR=1 FL=1
MMKTYRVVFQGLRSQEAVFRECMVQLGVGPDTVDRMLSRAPVPIKQDLTLRDARAYAEAIQEAGGRVCIQEHGELLEDASALSTPTVRPLESFTRCPECGLKQERAATCARCGCRLRPEP